MRSTPRRARPWTGRASSTTSTPSGRVVADANRYFAGEEPWAKRKTDPKRMETILYVTAEVVRQVAILAAPVMPGSAAKLLDGLGAGRKARSFAWLGEAAGSSRAPRFPRPPPSFRAMLERRLRRAASKPPKNHRKA